MSLTLSTENKIYLLHVSTFLTKFIFIIINLSTHRNHHGSMNVVNQGIFFFSKDNNCHIVESGGNKNADKYNIFNTNIKDNYINNL